MVSFVLLFQIQGLDQNSIHCVNGVHLHKCEIITSRKFMSVLGSNYEVTWLGPYTFVRAMWHSIWCVCVCVSKIGSLLLRV